MLVRSYIHGCPAPTCVPGYVRACLHPRECVGVGLHLRVCVCVCACVRVCVCLCVCVLFMCMDSACKRAVSSFISPLHDLRHITCMAHTC